VGESEGEIIPIPPEFFLSVTTDEGVTTQGRASDPSPESTGHRFRLGRAAVWASSWALGAALGVAAGAYLTVVGQAGAPGVTAIEPGTDLLLLPALAFAAVFVVHLGIRVVLHLVRRPRD
jgi:hypothetical protein